MQVKFETTANRTKLRPRWFNGFCVRLGTAARLLVLALLALPACLFSSTGPSLVGQGKKYSSGDPTFDEFFVTLHGHQVEMKKAPGMEKEIRKRLAGELKMEQGVSATLLTKKISKLATQLADAGTGLKLEVPQAVDEDAADEDDDAPSKASPVSLKTAGREPQGEEQVFVRAVERAARGEFKLLARMDKRKRQLEKLRGTVAVLDSQLDSAFRLGGPKKKSEVRKNLQDANALIPLMIARADDVGGNARKFLKKLEEVVSTDKGQFAAPPPPPAEPVEPTDQLTTPPAATPPAPAAPEEPPADKTKGKAKPPPPTKPAPTKPPAKPPAGAPAGASKTPPSDFEP
jgi:hypothetical protein